jgi:type II secretory pathway component HofQ
MAVLGLEQEIDAALTAALQTQRAEVISRPRFIVKNRVQSTVGAAEVPLEDRVAAGIPWKKLALSLSVTPTVAPDSRVKLDVNIIQEKIGQVVVRTGGTEVPAVDTAEFRSNAFVDSGSTVMFNVTTERLTSSATGREQRLVVFVTPTIMPDLRAPNR